jgi:hypothetical protein
MSPSAHPNPLRQPPLPTVVVTLSLLPATCGKSMAGTPDVIVIAPGGIANEPAPALLADDRVHSSHSPR